MAYLIDVETRKVIKGELKEVEKIHNERVCKADLQKKKIDLMIVTKEEDFAAKFSMSELVILYHHLRRADKPEVRKFESKVIASRRLWAELEAQDFTPPKKRSKRMGLTSREKVRAFLKKGVIFTIAEIAEMLNTNSQNASTTVGLLKTRPGSGHTPLKIEKTGEGRQYRVIQASEKIEV